LSDRKNTKESRSFDFHMEVNKETNPFLILNDRKAIVKLNKRIVSGELGMKDEAQYFHVTLMISDDHFMTGTPSF